jgi:hypothetical protein
MGEVPAEAGVQPTLGILLPRLCTLMPDCVNWEEKVPESTPFSSSNQGLCVPVGTLALYPAY